MAGATVAVKAFIVDKGKVLVLKRRLDDIHKPGQWDIPGGRLLPGEDPFEGLKRETKEETALEIAIDHPFAVRHFARDDGQIITMIIFACKVVASDVQLSEEHIEYQWMETSTAKVSLQEWLQNVVVEYQRLHKI